MADRKWLDTFEHNGFRYVLQDAPGHKPPRLYIAAYVIGASHSGPLEGWHIYADQRAQWQELVKARKPLSL